MVQNSRPSIQIDLNEFKLLVHLKSRAKITLHFNSPSRRFYLSVIALVVNDMKRGGKIRSIPLQDHLDLLVLLNESIGDSAGSSDRENLLHRIYTKWKDALPNLEEAPLFKVLGKKKEEGDGAIGKIYSFTDEEKDAWANLFDYMGSEENVRLKLAVDKLGVSLDETSIIFEDSLNGEAWDQFISSLKKDRKEESKPVQVEPEPKEATEVPETTAVPVSPPQGRKFLWLTRYRFVLVVVLIGIVTVGIWKIYLSSTPIQVASVDQMKYPLPANPSIAVLPFVNMSEDPNQEFLCDGMTEAIITALAKVPRLFVIARNSAFTYKGKPIKVKQVAEDLGVRYVLEGSVQRSGDRVRITAQLVDALAGNHLWAERYDRDLKDIFALQDEITIKILTATQVRLTEGEVSWAHGKYFRGKRGLDCYLKIMEGKRYWERATIEDNNLARRIAEEAIAICPEIPMAYLLMARVHYTDYWLGSTTSPRESIEKAIELAQKSLALDNTLAEPHNVLSFCYTMKREYDKAIAEAERAVALNPSGANAFNQYAISLDFAGRSEEAIPLFQKAIRLNPFGPAAYYRHFGNALQMTGRFEEAVSAYKKAIQRAPDNFWNHVMLVATYSKMGREKEARAEAAEVLRINPKFSLGFFAKTSAYKEQSVRDNLFNALQKAGVK
jgi:TolB-like protein/Flp pilus assembly protein TadD